MKPLVNYKDFLAKRFDLVIRYHILREVDFDFDKAKDRIINSEKYVSLRRAYKTLALPITHDMKIGRLWKRFHDRIDLYMAHNLFFVKNYHWIEQAVETDHWCRAEPYGVRDDGGGVPTKRFLVALKLNKPLYWQQGGWINSFKPVPRPTCFKENYKRLLLSKMFTMFEDTQKDMMEHMKRLHFFTEKFKIETSLVKYDLFLHKRFDFVIRYLLMEQANFDVREAQKLWEVKKAKGKLVDIEGATDKYNFLDKMLKGKKFFDLLENWDYIENSIKKDSLWLMYNPYIITTHNIGISIKRFFIALKYKKPLYWIATDVYNSKYNKRLIQAPWSIDFYKEHLTKKEFKLFNTAKFRLMARMVDSKCFCESTKVGGLANEHFSLRDLSDR